MTDRSGGGNGTFVPEITAFTCIYCGYQAADTAGALRMKYPSNVKLIRLPCTGKVDLRYILEAFEQGADGVYVVACPIGNCHHVHGNERAAARVSHAKDLLDQIGIDGDRLEIVYASGGMGATFAETARRVTERIKEMGPSPLK